MRNIFIHTENTKIFEEACAEMMSASSFIGPSLAMLTGPAGRGKTEAAKHYAVHHDAIYIPPLNIRTPPMILREISFNLQHVRPQRSDKCLSIISESMTRERRIVLIDEADLLPMQILEMLRNLNEYCACPIVLIGEDSLKARIASRRRIDSRMRHRLEFGPVSREDIAYFVKANVGLKIDTDAITLIHRRCGGDWRPALTLLIAINRMAKASNTKEISTDMVKNALQNA